MPTSDDLPSFDAEAFGAWLRRYKAAVGLEWGEISDRSGIHISTVMGLARGVPQKERRERGQKTIAPNIVTIARLAHGLGLEFGFVASKGGIYGGGADRWEHFTKSERALIESALMNPLFDTPGGWDDVRRRLLADMQSTDQPTKDREEVPA